jgi:hypothetical protein
VRSVSFILPLWRPRSAPTPQPPSGSAFSELQKSGHSLRGLRPDGPFPVKVATSIFEHLCLTRLTIIFSSSGANYFPTHLNFPSATIICEPVCLSLALIQNLRPHDARARVNFTIPRFCLLFFSAENVASWQLGSWVSDIPAWLGGVGSIYFGFPPKSATANTATTMPAAKPLMKTISKRVWPVIGPPLETKQLQKEPKPSPTFQEVRTPSLPTCRYVYRLRWHL